MFLVGIWVIFLFLFVSGHVDFLFPSKSPSIQKASLVNLNLSHFFFCSAVRHPLNQEQSSAPKYKVPEALEDGSKLPDAGVSAEEVAKLEAFGVRSQVLVGIGIKCLTECCLLPVQPPLYFNQHQCFVVQSFSSPLISSFPLSPPTLLIFLPPNALTYSHAVSTRMAWHGMLA